MTIGDIVVHRGDPFGHPRLNGLMGEERAAALKSFGDRLATNVVWDDERGRHIVPLQQYTFWYAPFGAAPEKLLDAWDGHQTYRTIFDINGNDVGRYRLKLEK